MPDVERGRRKILTAVVGAASFMMAGALASWRRGPVFHPVSQLGAPAVLAALGILMYRGAHWAREAVVAWLGLAALAYAGGGISIMLRFPVYGLLALFFAAAFAYDAFVLYTSEDVEAVVNPGAFPSSTLR